MRIYVTEDYCALSRRAAWVIAAQIITKPNCVLGLATGSTPIGTYESLAEWYRRGDLSFRDVTTVNLDEYKGLAPTHDQSYRYFMNTHLFDLVNVRKDRTFVPDGLAEDPQAECTAYDERLRELGYADLQLLGIGHNGHIGFNEPSESFIVPTHVVDLTERTIEANARFFASADEVPRQALTMGMGAIMNARKILVVASGEDKAEAVRGMVKGPVEPGMPASILQLHPDVTVVVDKAAASKLG